MITDIHSNSDGSHIEDDYAALIYNDVIEDRISAIVDQYLKKDQYKYDIVYKVTAEAYKSKDQLEDYLRETDTYIDIEITLENEKPEQAAEKIFLLVQKIYENNIHFMIRLNYNGKIIIGNDSENSVFMSLDELLDRMVEE